MAAASTALPSEARRVIAVAAGARAAQFVDSLLFLLVAVEAGAGTGNAALALLVYHLGVVAGTTAAGALVDRLGPRPIVATGLVLAAAGAGVLAGATGAAVLVAAAAVYGTGGAGWRLALETAAARALAAGAADAEADLSQRLRARGFAALAGVRNAGALVSATAVAAGIDIATAIAIQAGVSLIAGAVALVALPSGKAAEAPAAPPDRTERELWLLALATAPAVLLVFQAFSGLAAAYDEDTFRLVVLVNAVVLVLAGPAVSALSIRLGGGHVLIAATVLLGVSMGLAPLLDGPAPVAAVGWSVGELALYTITPALVTGLAPAAATGHYQARFAVVQGLVAAVAATGGPLLVEQSEAAFALTAVALGLVGALALRVLLPVIKLSLSAPVGCPCGALICACGPDHGQCGAATPVRVHEGMMRPAARVGREPGTDALAAPH